MVERRPAQVLSADFLAAEDLIPFWGRSRDLSVLQDWATSATGPSLCVLTGPPLVGKTRLSIELAKTVPEEWTTGRLRMHYAVGAIAKIRGGGRPALVVVEAPGWHEDLLAFLSDAARHGARLPAGGRRHGEDTPLRVLLVTRSERWLPAVREEAPDLADTLDDALRVELSPFGSAANHAEWLRAAGLSLARQSVALVPRDPRAARRLDPTTSIGELLARALLASRVLHGTEPARLAASPAQVAEALAEHERSQWPDPDSGIVISRGLRTRALASIHR